MRLIHIPMSSIRPIHVPLLKLWLRQWSVLNYVGMDLDEPILIAQVINPWVITWETRRN